MIGVFAGIIGFAAWTYAVVAVILPWLFNLVQSLFDSADLGTIAALAACFVALGPIIWVYAMIIIVAGVLGASTQK